MRYPQTLNENAANFEVDTECVSENSANFEVDTECVSENEKSVQTRCSFPCIKIRF